MELKRVGSQPSVKGPEAWFTGTVRIDPLNTAPEPSRVSVASVTFEPGARSARHTHPLGQTLVVTAGCGWTQCEGEPIVEIRAGDVIWCPPRTQTLARRFANHLDDSYCNPGGAGRRGRGLAGKGHR